MRPRFEKDLSAYSKLSKEEQAGFEATEEAEQFNQVLEWHLKQAMERQGTSIEDQRHIYEIQQEKQKIMTRLQEQLVCIDEPECVLETEENSRPANYNPKYDVFEYASTDGKTQNATFGEIVTDVEWGITYALDKSAPRQMLKRYYIECAKHDLAELLDRQIIISEMAGNLTAPERKEVYGRYEAELESGKMRKRAGFIAETMVKNFLRKIIYDHGAGFEILEADIYQDIEQKIDFVIRLILKQRGVRVEADEKEKDIGIQFTLNPMVRHGKRKQIEKAKGRLEAGDIDDIILVTFPMQMAEALVKQWQNAGSPAGGPDKLLHRHTAEKLFKTVMKELLSPDEIDRYWKKFGDYFREKVA